MAVFPGKSGTLSTPSNPSSPDPKGDTPDGLRRLYGRRQAFALRARQEELVKDLLPKLEISVPEEGAFDPATLFPDAKEVWLEIGFGGGEHLAWQASANPDIGMIGCEPFINGYAKLLSKIDEQGQENIRILPADARPLLEALPEASIARAFLLFPDPWPKSRHHKRRFVQKATLDQLARVLKDGAEFRVASDIPGYVAWTLERVMPHPDFVWTAEGPDDWNIRGDDWAPTRYEQKAIKAGRVPAYLKFKRLPREI